MRGPDHYREAERLLTEHEYSSSSDALAAAQVHATLALAMAVADHTASRGPGDVGDDWKVLLA